MEYVYMYVCMEMCNWRICIIFNLDLLHASSSYASGSGMRLWWVLLVIPPQQMPRMESKFCRYICLVMAV